MLEDGTITARIRSTVELDGAARRSNNFATAASAARPSFALRPGALAQAPKPSSKSRSKTVAQVLFIQFVRTF